MRHIGLMITGQNTLEDPHGGGEIVNTSGGLEGGNDDGGGGYKIVGEGVVEVALYIYQSR